MAETEAMTTDVLIVGAGPAGLLVARELQIAGVATMLIDKLPQRSGICRGFTLNARSLDILARRNMLQPFLENGWKVPHAAFSGLPVTPMLQGSWTDHPYTIGIGQDRVEQLLEAYAVSAGVVVRWGHELVSFQQADSGVVAVVTANGCKVRVRARYLVGCDGSRSAVRRLAGIEFPGTTAKRLTLLGDVEIAQPGDLTLGTNSGPGGSLFVIPRPGYVRILVRDPQPPIEKDTPVLLEQLTEAVGGVMGRKVTLRNPRWLTRFGDAARLAARYVAGRVLLAGDAAHIHPPAGAIGVNVALDDAFNMGWKLAVAVHGNAPDHILETYHEERHAVGKRVLENTQAQVLLAHAGKELEPLHGFLTRLLSRQDVNMALAELLTCLDTCYERQRQADAHPWQGRMAPDFALRVHGTETRLTALLSEGRPLLIDSTEGRYYLRSRERRHPNIYAVPAESLPQPAPEAMLIRPDGHVAWSSSKDSVDGNELHEAIAYWFGGSRT